MRSATSTNIRLNPLCEEAVRDAIVRFERTGSPAITDGERHLRYLQPPRCFVSLVKPRKAANFISLSPGNASIGKRISVDCGVEGRDARSDWFRRRLLAREQPKFVHLQQNAGKRIPLRGLSDVATCIVLIAILNVLDSLGG
jgi:hypothetical protein